MNLFPSAQAKMVCNSSRDPIFDIELLRYARRYDQCPFRGANFSFFLGAVFTIHHCSACAKNDPRWCGPQSPFYQVDADATLTNANDTLAVRHLAGDLKASEPILNAFRVGGLFQASSNATMTFSITTVTGVHATAAVSFPAPDAPSFTVSDDISHVAYDCQAPKYFYGKFDLACKLPSGGYIWVSGKINAV
jgi:hypothetical protein